MALTKEKTVAAAPTMNLELALFTRYRMGGVAYEKGKVYSFSQATAIKLLGETDANRPVWRVYKPKAVKDASKQDVTIIDATKNVIKANNPSLLGDEAKSAEGRIDIGDDAEIAEILPKDEDVTV